MKNESRNILKKLLQCIMKFPGVKLDIPIDVPLYRADPNGSKYLIRTLNGKDEYVRRRHGKYVVVDIEEMDL